MFNKDLCQYIIVWQNGKKEKDYIYLNVFERAHWRFRHYITKDVIYYSLQKLDLCY